MAAARSRIRAFWKDIRDKQNGEKRDLPLSASLPTLKTTMQDTQRTGSTHDRLRGRAKRAATGLPALEGDELRSSFQTQDDDEDRIQKLLLEEDRKHRWVQGNYLAQETSRRLRDVQGDLENREVAVFEQRSKEAAESEWKPKYAKYKGVISAPDALSKLQRTEDIERVKETLVDEHRTLRSVLRIDDEIDVVRMIGESRNEENQLEGAMKSEAFMRMMSKLQILNDEVRDMRERRKQQTERNLAKFAVGAQTLQLQRTDGNGRRGRRDTPKVSEERKATPLNQHMNKMDSWMSRNVAAGMFAGSVSTGAMPPVKTAPPPLGRPLPANFVVIPKAVAEARETAVRKFKTT